MNDVDSEAMSEQIMEIKLMPVVEDSASDPVSNGSIMVESEPRSGLKTPVYLTLQRFYEKACICPDCKPNASRWS